MNKKGVELNVAAIIIVILAILVLVIISLYFTGGMQALWQQIIGKKASWDTSAIEEAKRSCAFYCTLGDKDFFCNHEFTIGYDADGIVIQETCVGNEIKAYNLEDCRNAGFSKDICPET